MTALASTRGAAGGRRADQAFRLVCLIAGLAVLAVLAMIVTSTTHTAWPAFAKAGLGLVVGNDWRPASGSFGALALLYGTLIVSVIALVISVPISLGIALFINEVSPPRLRRPVTYAIDLLAAVPSVVYGLWGVQVLAPPARDVYLAISDVCAGWPLVSHVFGGNVTGTCLFTAGLILSVMITPIITSLAREVIATAPRGDKEAAYGMGATRWEMIRVAVLPRSRGGLVGAVMLGLGRAMGETIAVALVIGSQPQITARLFESGDAMAATIANNFSEATGDFRAALVGLGVVLFGITIAVNMLARLVVNQIDRRTQGLS